MNESQRAFCQKEIGELAVKITQFKNWMDFASSEEDRVYWQGQMKAYETQKKVFELALQDNVSPPLP